MISKISTGKSFKYELGLDIFYFILFFYILINNKCCFTLVLLFFFKCFFIMWIRWNWKVNKFKKTNNIKKFHISYTIRLFFFLSQIFIFGIISIEKTLSVGSFTRCFS